MVARTYQLKEYSSISVFDQLPSSEEDLTDMSLTHKQPWFIAEQILRNGEIAPEKCDVFPEETLAYFFYGRPAYSDSTKNNFRGDSSHYPVCFLLDIETVEISNVFPFDSGAFAEGRYDGFIHSRMDVNSFSISPSVQAIKDFIAYFYGGNDQYYRSNIKSLSRSETDDLEMQAYINLLDNRGETSFDERYSTIEVLSKKSVVLQDSMVAIFAPVGFKRRNAELLKQLEASGVDVITYDTFGGSPNSYNGVVRDKIYQYFCDKGIINHNVV